jgi:hypothetical protein
MTSPMNFRGTLKIRTHNKGIGVRMNRTGTSKALPWLVVLYTAASLLHFTHNAEFLNAYPNLPSWISRSGVYISWVSIAAIGAVGYALVRLGRETSGLAVLALYACLGFDGLRHYQRAPFAAHTTAMNLSILFEVAAATILLIAVARRGFQHFRTRPA